MPPLKVKMIYPFVSKGENAQADWSVFVCRRLAGNKRFVKNEFDHKPWSNQLLMFPRFKNAQNWIGEHLGHPKQFYAHVYMLWIYMCMEGKYCIYMLDYTTSSFGFLLATG